jgi:hypothetical protein
VPISHIMSSWRIGDITPPFLCERDKGPNAVAQADNSRMSTALWILIAVLAVGIIAGGLLRIRAWLRRPAPPEIVDAARRRNEQDDRSPD